HWANLQDTHEFFGMLNDFKVGRHQAMRLAGSDFVRPVSLQAPRQMLEAAAENGVPIMCFVGNRGCIQIHTGPVKTIKVMGPWLNVLDPDFNLHLREDAIAHAYVVRKPTRDGDVTSLELFDAEGKNFVMFFGERKPGQVEREDWRSTVRALEPGSRQAA
ncbi:MAG: ChuX/HutX family heme-like substrate-binding protein, partial [Pseudomonadota bacterium]